MSRLRPIRFDLTLVDAERELAILAEAGIEAASPELGHGQSNPPIATGDFKGYRIIAREQDLLAAHKALDLPRGSENHPYPCPNCAAATRRELRIGLFFFGAWLTHWPFPMRRRKRFCPACRYRYMPDAPEPFTAQELGWDPQNENALAELLEYTRSIGYHDEHEEEERDRDEPSR